MIKADKGKVQIVGKGTEVFAELMLVCSKLKQETPENNGMRMHAISWKN